MSERNWEAMGLTWSAEPVSKRYGENDSDKRVVATAQIPVVTDVDKFRKEFGDVAITAALNGTSYRVTAQGIARDHRTATPETLREKMYLRLKGIRSRITAAIAVEVPTYPVPGAEAYKGTDKAEYVAALVDAGISAEVAIAFADSTNLK